MAHTYYGSMNVVRKIDGGRIDRSRSIGFELNCDSSGRFHQPLDSDNIMSFIGGFFLKEIWCGVIGPDVTSGTDIYLYPILDSSLGVSDLLAGQGVNMYTLPYFNKAVLTTPAPIFQSLRLQVLNNVYPNSRLYFEMILCPSIIW